LFIKYILDDANNIARSVRRAGVIMGVQEAWIPASSLQGNYLLRLFHSRVPPGRRHYRDHHHTAFEIAVFKSGTGLYTVGSRQYSIRPGDIFLFSSQEVHCITEIDPGDDMVLMNVHFEPRFIWSPGNELFDTKYLRIFLDRSDLFQNRLDRDHPVTSVVRQLLLQIEQEFASLQPEYELMVKILLLTILATVSRNFRHMTKDRPGLSFARQQLAQIEAAMNYIDEQLVSDISLDDLAHAANMSRSYFCTVFKRLNGISPWDYMTARRIERAVDLLQTTDKTVLEIACQCGFNNTANFNRAFKKVTGRVPSGYR
jgi:AraC-like DNA-binding protein/quercetin dioxygenase-like cupin family protein